MKQFLTIVVASLALTACNHKDLCYIDSQKHKIFVEYDWSEAPDATAGGMCVFFYSMDNAGAYYRFDFDNTEGGEIEIPAGNYRLITYNNDTEVVRFSGSNDFENHMAYTRDGDLLEPLYGNGIKSTTTTDNGERVFITPDGLWGCHATDVVINEHGVTYTVVTYARSRGCEDCEEHVYGNQVITLYPHDMLCHYTYEVRNVDNAEYVSKVSAALSGMSRAMTLADEALDSEHVTLPVSGSADGSSHKITGQFLTFGHGDDTSVRHKMTFFVVMTDGSKYRIDNAANLDVTDQVDNAPDRRHVHIIIDRLSLPEPGTENGDWSPTVDDWGVHNEELKI